MHSRTAWGGGAGALSTPMEESGGDDVRIAGPGDRDRAGAAVLRTVDGGVDHCGAEPQLIKEARARNLERAIGAILVGTASLDGDERIGRGGARADVNAYLSAFKRTSVWQMAQAGTVRGPR